MSEDLLTPRRARGGRAGRGSVGSVLVAAAVLSLLLSGCRTTAPSGPGPDGIALEGMASWYGQEFAGRPTANGEIFDPESMTAAHRTLPFGTIIDVTNLKNGRTTRIRINDRGPFVGNRIIDLSYAAARSLDMVEDGVSRVSLEIVRIGKGEREPPRPYAVKIDSEPNQPVPTTTPEPTEFQPPRPAPEPVTTIDEDPIEAVELPTDPPLPAPAPRTTQRAEPGQPPPPPSAQPARGWKVQVGAFSVEENATRFAQTLRSIVSPVYVELVGGLHRVRVGPFTSRVDAIEASERVQAAGYDAIVMSPDAR